jgi:hypothetical protein
MTARATGRSGTTTEVMMSSIDDARIDWEHDWDTALERARGERRLLLIDVEKEN